MTMEDRIIGRLTEALAPVDLTVIDDSGRHAGHAGVRTGPGHAQAGGGTHYRIRIVSARFTGLNRVARHRLVYDLLPAEFADGLHALAIDAKAPGEP
ncbi:BolA protein [Roseiarcus fermentans]|uniref:BolA protein n=1 Tax=Roseiarcus fermentans TaxID=1473586 RepID=A0A366EVJ0_9HYPH|nr:BolA family protein [Roseiarcus fermentans]RBP06402.1 BolA protein [Roseiarcus fermentans]